MKKACILSTRMKNNFMSHISPKYLEYSEKLLRKQLFADVLQNRCKITQNSQETPTLESLFNKAADPFYYRKIAVAMCGYFKNNLHLILYGVEIRSCQCLFNLIQQFYVQNQKYKFEKKRKRKSVTSVQIYK